MRLKWTICPAEEWYRAQPEESASAETYGAEGVYIIWHGGQQPGVVVVGQGPIGEALRAEFADPGVLVYAVLELFVAFAPVPGWARNGIASYLARRLWPKLDRPLPAARPIEVNLPW